MQYPKDIQKINSIIQERVPKQPAGQYLFTYVGLCSKVFF